MVSSRQAAGNNYVTVTLYGLDELADNETYTISQGKTASGNQISSLFTSGSTMNGLGRFGRRYCQTDYQAFYH